jgi:deazaflavin-dependent oxidoreductase (nitroreductase family)
MAQRRTRPNWLLRLLFKAPVALYRLRLGFLLGYRFLMVTHRGRRTGKVRRTVVEVVRYDNANQESFVAAGYGDTSDWYRNLKASPALEIRTGNQRFVPAQRFLGTDEIYVELANYERRHPGTFRKLMRVVGLSYDGSDAQRWALAEALPMVAFRPRSLKTGHQES